MPEWDWDPDDFAVLWYSDANDRFPPLISYTSRFPSNDEVAAHRTAVRARYDAEETELIRRAFHTLTNCELRVEILGSSTTLGKGVPREYRIVGARDANHAVLVTQTAGDDSHGRIRCRLFPTEQLAPRLAHILPTFPAGTAQPATFHLADATDAAGYRRLAKRPADGGGAAGLLAGYLHNAAEPWYTAQWIDVADDGRYLQQCTREHLTVRPAGTADLTALFSGWFDQALRRLRDDADEPW
ncbi:ESX secretion-associated protein EspG [Nocardia sp. NPDC003482]